MELNRETMKRIMLLILYTILLLALAFRLEKAAAFLGWMFRLVIPFLLGGAIAFILNVPMRRIEETLPKGKKDGTWRRPVSLVLSILLLVLILGVVVFLVLPQLTKTFFSLAELIPQFLGKLRSWVEETFVAYPEITAYLDSVSLQIDWKETLERVAGFVTTGAGTVLSSTLTAAMSIASGLTSFSISFIFAMYILLQKEKLLGQLKRFCYAYLPERAASEIFRVGRMTEQTFSRFLTGQCTEAVILGTMFFVTLAFFRMPYPLLIGVLIAFTALIPIFGAFIGCAIGIFLMLMVNPIQAIWFTILFFVLQQIEGNLIYPHVVGNSVGLPSIWVLVAVSVGGSMLGIVGMLIFIPLCSVVYALVREDVGRRLEKKGVHKAKKTGAPELEEKNPKSDAP